MPTNRRQIADDLAEHAHDVLTGVDPTSVVQNLEYRIQDLIEISDNESPREKETEEKTDADTSGP